MEKFEIVKAYEDFKKRLNDIYDVQNMDSLKEELLDNETKMSESSFWLDSDNASKVNQRNNFIKEKISEYKVAFQSLDDVKTLLELNDESLFSEAEHMIKTLQSQVEILERSLLFYGEFDESNAIVELHPGAGGTEAQDWASMLYRMYKRYCERSNLEVECLDFEEGEEAGIKSVTFVVKGKFAFGLFRGERGVHRLVRISPFDSNKRRHTSFASVTVIPEIKDNNVIEIKPEEIRIDTYRSSGAGGQHINKTDSAIRITHFPTGIVVTCQNQRSQIQNRETALQVLKSKLYEINLRELEEKKKELAGVLRENGFGSQIRSYILQPYLLVKDHRTNTESTNPADVLDGNIDIFIDSYLKWSRKMSV